MSKEPEGPSDDEAKSPTPKDAPERLNLQKDLSEHDGDGPPITFNEKVELIICGTAIISSLTLMAGTAMHDQMFNALETTAGVFIGAGGIRSGAISLRQTAHTCLWLSMRKDLDALDAKTWGNYRNLCAEGDENRKKHYRFKIWSLRAGLVAHIALLGALLTATIMIRKAGPIPLPPVT